VTSRIGETGEVTTAARPRSPGRTTRQGLAVERVLFDADAFLSAQDIHAALRDAGEGVGLATVYRHLQKLSESGVVDAVTGSDGELTYRSCGGEPHHHHLVCRSCRRSTALASQEVEQWASRQAAARGYTDVTHTVEIFGTCAACRRGAPRARRSPT
jgi:Fur family transcriptional regulator, ferric uptake regulator